jgi:pimeloyl-ACP methyl ester carboxylesterase
MKLINKNKEIKVSTQFLKLDPGTIAYDDTGRGPLVLCAPSMGDLRGEYRFLIPQLVTAGYRVVTMDVRGHGETSPRWPDVSVGAVGGDMLALIRSLNAGPAVIIGTSMAAGAGVWAAAEAPELVSGLVLIGPFVRGESTWQFRLLFGALLARPWGPAMWLRYFKTLFPTRKPADFAEYCSKLQANLKEPGRLEALFGMLMASKSASEQRLPRVKAPSLVIMGSLDPDFKIAAFGSPEAEAQRVGASLHGAVQMITGAGHYPHAEMPEVTGPMILSLLETLRH